MSEWRCAEFLDMDPRDAVIETAKRFADASTADRQTRAERSTDLTTAVIMLRASGARP